MARNRVPLVLTKPIDETELYELECLVLDVKSKLADVRNAVEQSDLRIQQLSAYVAKLRVENEELLKGEGQQ